VRGCIFIRILSLREGQRERERERDRDRLSNTGVKSSAPSHPPGHVAMLCAGDALDPSLCKSLSLSLSLSQTNMAALERDSEAKRQVHTQESEQVRYCFPWDIRV